MSNSLYIICPRVYPTCAGKFYQATDHFDGLPHSITDQVYTTIFFSKYLSHITPLEQEKRGPTMENHSNKDDEY